MLPFSSQHSSRPSSNQLPQVISSSLSDQFPSLSHLEVPPILQQPFISEEIDPPFVSSDPALPLLDTTDPDEDFHGFEPVSRRSNCIRAQTKSFLATPDFPPNTDISDSDIDDPGNSFTYLEAVSGSDSSFWLAAMQKEMSFLEDNLTWTLTSLQSNHVAIKVRWVYKVKRNIDGSIERRRARLVVKGFTQRPGIDFTETFSPVLKYDSLRVILAIAAVDDLDLFQFDVASAFLQSPLVGELYVEQPPGFCVVGRERDVYRLHKCLYGLRQASRAWNDTFNDFLSAFGLVASEADPCVYLFQSGKDFLIVALWVDDGLLICNNSELLAKILSYLKTTFVITLKPADRFVGLHITRDRVNRKLYLSQPSYIAVAIAYNASLLSTFRMTDCNPTKTPAHPNSRLFASSIPPTEKISILRSG